MRSTENRIAGGRSIGGCDARRIAWIAECEWFTTFERTKRTGTASRFFDSFPIVDDWATPQPELQHSAGFDGLVQAAAATCSIREVKLHAKAGPHIETMRAMTVTKAEAKRIRRLAISSLYTP